MFSLIITVISIALVAALAVASVYYLGGQAKSAGAKVAAAEYMNIGETIKGAINMYRATNGNQMPADIDALVAAELLGSDLGGTWALAGDNVTQADIDVDTCAIVNLMIHDEEVVYNCTDMPSGKPGCCDTTDSQV